MSEGSWGHYILLVAPEAVAKEAALPHPWRHQCRVSRKCRQPTAYLIGFSYVSGRRGNVSTREQTACQEHARQFAAKHAVVFPPTNPPVDVYRQPFVIGELKPA